VGDSITAGGKWQQAFPHLSIANHGVSGDTTLDVIARLPRIKTSGAQTYFLMVGINDILRGSAPGSIAPRILTIKNALEAPAGTRVVLQSVLPCQRSKCGEQVLQRVDELNRLLVELTPPADFLDLAPGLSDASGGLRANLTDDGLHLNAEGYQRWQAQLVPFLEALAPGAAGPGRRRAVP
jgi:lysophospholipase L1-like esterase